MSTDSGPSSRRDDLPGVERLLTLSDGVVAIALTLLVLQLKVPPLAHVADPSSASELATQLGNGADQLISYVISFYVIAQFWLVHYRVFRQVARPAGGSCLVELRLPVHHHRHAVHQQPSWRVRQQSARGRHLRRQPAARQPGHPGDTRLRAA